MLLVMYATVWCLQVMFQYINIYSSAIMPNMILISTHSRGQYNKASMQTMLQVMYFQRGTQWQSHLLPPIYQLTCQLRWPWEKHIHSSGSYSGVIFMTYPWLIRFLQRTKTASDLSLNILLSFCGTHFIRPCQTHLEASIHWISELFKN